MGYPRVATCDRPYRGLAACPEPPYNQTPVKKPRRKSVPVDPAPTAEYLSVAQLARLIPYREQTIRNLMSKGVFQLGVHYTKPRGRRGRVMFRWSAVRAWLDERA
jgi:hypothetical protein